MARMKRLGMSSTACRKTGSGPPSNHAATRDHKRLTYPSVSIRTDGLHEDSECLAPDAYAASPSRRAGTPRYRAAESCQKCANAVRLLALTSSCEQPCAWTPVRLHVRQIPTPQRCALRPCNKRNRPIRNKPAVAGNVLSIGRDFASSHINRPRNGI